MLSKNTLNLLQCKRCKTYLSSSPVYSFQDGTNLCKSCYQKEPKGFKQMKHVCNDLYANTVRELDFPCQYSCEGCEETIPFDRPYEHDCMYGKSFKCPVAEDGFKGTIKEIQDHLKSQHENTMFTDHEISFPIKRSSVSVLQQNKHLFTICKNQQLKELKLFAHIQGRVLVGASYINTFSKHQLEIVVREITYKKCREKFTLTFRQEPDFILTRKCQISTFTTGSRYGDGYEIQNLTSLFEISRGRDPEIYCTISLNVLEAESLIENTGTSN